MSANLKASQLSILLIEPSEVQRKVISRHLADAGVSQVDTAASIQEGKQKLAYLNPDLVVSAMYFADGDADQLLHFMHEQPQLQATPFMLVSSEHKKSQLEQFKQAGIIAILPKPFTIEHLQRALNATVDLMEPTVLQLNNFDAEDLRVLLVDDSMTSRHYLARVLRSLGVENISEAENGTDAIQHLESQQFDLIVTDYHMPVMNGQEFAETVRMQPGQEHVPILMVSARADELQLEQIEQSGVNALTDKPFEPETLRNLLARLLDDSI
ncbi:two-component system response regulator [Aliidiomarina minuta]|uniref:Two-component system response regulator n=1 Tax=Aliidiomarina minuta TaxID=880057 RepID=A0A432W7P8_9GAMM|nr:response regulator [Aliidiomarina minuta]RUO26104.1 two-component system response regulator [Aliidiomarina minuta]